MVVYRRTEDGTALITFQRIYVTRVSEISPFVECSKRGGSENPVQITAFQGSRPVFLVDHHALATFGAQQRQEGCRPAAMA